MHNLDLLLTYWPIITTMAAFLYWLIGRPLRSLDKRLSVIETGVSMNALALKDHDKLDVTRFEALTKQVGVVERRLDMRLVRGGVLVNPGKLE